jgi:hypothetical protein
MGQEVGLLSGSSSHRQFVGKSVGADDEHALRRDQLIRKEKKPKACKADGHAESRHDLCHHTSS